MAAQGSLPAYLRISERLIREIGAGRLRDGDRLPPERSFAKDMGVSVGTLRKALAELEGRGLLERRQGSGNYIRSQSRDRGVYAFFRLELIGGGGLPTAEILTLDAMEKPADLPQFGRSDRAYRIRRLRRLDDRPAAVEEIWLDGSYAPSLRRRDILESLYYYYRQSLNLWITEIEDHVSISHVPDWAPSGFPPRPGTPCGFVERLSRDQTGASVEFSRNWFDASVARYVSRMR